MLNLHYRACALMSNSHVPQNSFATTLTCYALYLRYEFKVRII